MKIKTVILLSLLFCLRVSGQEVFYQDIFHGGVTAGGFSTGQGSGSGTVNLHIEPGSTIRKAYLFSYTLRYPPLVPITVNGISYTFDTLNIMNVSYTNTYARPVKLYSKDITADLIAAPTSTFNITIPYQPGLPINAGWWTAFLYIEYEKNSLPLTSSIILINNENLKGNELYAVNNLNPIITSFPVGFSLYTDRTGANFAPDEKVYFNSNLLGTIGGSDNVNSSWTYAGVKGHFYYQNNTLFGLDDDSPDALMDSTDGLADVSSYLLNNSTSINFRMTNILYPNQANNKTDFNLAYFLTYTTPCDTFPNSVSTDTTVCPGEQLQLQASGGTKYEWKPISDTTSNNLSCTNCPNPIFSGDSSQVYTVRIWNTDSCSVVRPVRVTVRPQPKAPSIQTDSTLCGTTIGKISTANNQNESIATLFAVSNGGDTLTTATKGFPGLPANGYTVFYSDTNGCVSLDTVVTINSFNTTIADFEVHPDKGATPLQVDIQNQSQNATDYSWWLNGAYQGNSFSDFLADTSGTYHIQLIAWNKDSICADTCRLTVVAFDNVAVQIYNLVSPNKDGKNDTWIIKGITKYPDNEVHIFNRWGNVVFSAQDYQNDWGGKDAGSGKILPSGTYFYTIKINYKGKEKKLKGYLELVR